MCEGFGNCKCLFIWLLFKKLHQTLARPDDTRPQSNTMVFNLLRNRVWKVGAYFTYFAWRPVSLRGGDQCKASVLHVEVRDGGTTGLPVLQNEIRRNASIARAGLVLLLSWTLTLRGLIVLQFLSHLLCCLQKLNNKPVTLSTTYPKRMFLEPDMARTLLDLELVPSSVLIVLPAVSNIPRVNNRDDTIARFLLLCWLQAWSVHGRFTVL